MKEIIVACIEFVKNLFKERYDGHDFQHTERVYRKAMYIAKEEGANNFICALAALLHEVDDVDDEKPYGDCPLARQFMLSQNLDPKIIDWVSDIINNMSFRKNDARPKTIEAKVVMDADMLDSIGAVGIARCFAAGAVRGTVLYDGDINNDNVIRVFYNDLLKVVNKMNTDTGKEMAKRRHEFMEKFLQEFYYEWNI